MNKGGRSETYGWAKMKVNHHLFFPGKTVEAFRKTVHSAGKRHGFKLSMSTVAMGGEIGVLVWRRA